MGDANTHTGSSHFDSCVQADYANGNHFYLIGDDDGNAQEPTALFVATSNAAANRVDCSFYQYLNYPCQNDPHIYSGPNGYQDYENQSFYGHFVYGATLGSPNYSMGTSGAGTATPPTFPISSIYLDTGGSIQYGNGASAARISSLAQGTISIDKTLGVASASYVSGGSVSGLPGQTCSCSSFNNSCSGTMATVTLAGTNTLVGSTWTITNRGTGCTAAATSCTLLNGSATCSSAPTITSSLGGAHDGILLTGIAGAVSTPISTMYLSGVLHSQGVAYASLPAATVGDLVYCTDCQVANASTCAPTNSLTAQACWCVGGGHGQFAKYEDFQNGGSHWYCN